MGSILEGERDVVPSCLRDCEQWVCWRSEQRNGKATKIPVTPGSGEFASSTDRETWTTFEAALDYAETGGADGVGFVFTEDDPFVGVDLDDFRNPETGDVDGVAADIIERLDSYTEVSPSGTGFHVLVEGELPDGGNRRGSVELYEHARFFTVTGDHVAGTPTRVARRQDALAAIHREYVQDTVGANPSTSGERGGPSEQSGSGGPSKGGSDVGLDDEELVAKAREASNGEKFERLYLGNTVGYESQSEADMALCCLLAFWTGGDQTQIDRLFRQSGLLRGKWDEVHYADGSTYGEKTVERAVRRTSEFYDPDVRENVLAESTRKDVSAADSEGEDAGRSRAYLSEKNRLLTDRVEELETLLEWKNDRIDDLETELEQQEANLKECDRPGRL
uniref:phage NrS-1 polymerase family protein n=1 Tax=Halorussus halophilus TaxID=2650975 RepID=UPI0034A1C922